MGSSSSEVSRTGKSSSRYKFLTILTSVVISNNLVVEKAIPRVRSYAAPKGFDKKIKLTGYDGARLKNTVSLNSLS